jgi:hypothetical protein
MVLPPSQDFFTSVPGLSAHLLDPPLKQFSTSTTLLPALHVDIIYFSFWQLCNVSFHSEVPVINTYIFWNYSPHFFYVPQRSIFLYYTVHPKIFLNLSCICQCQQWQSFSLVHLLNFIIGKSCFFFLVLRKLCVCVCVCVCVCLWLWKCVTLQALSLSSLSAFLCLCLCLFLSGPCLCLLTGQHPILLLACSL